MRISLPFKTWCYDTTLQLNFCCCMSDKMIVTIIKFLLVYVHCTKKKVWAAWNLKVPNTILLTCLIHHSFDSPGNTYLNGLKLLSEYINAKGAESISDYYESLKNEIQIKLTNLKSILRIMWKWIGKLELYRQVAKGPVAYLQGTPLGLNKQNCYKIQL